MQTREFHRELKTIERMIIMTTFADRLKRAMALAHMSQSDFSAKASISKAAISQYLSGKNQPKAEKIAHMAEVLGTTAAILAGYESPQTPQKVSAERISTRTAARCLGKSENFIRNGLQNGILPFGSAVPGTGKKFIYYINPDQFREYAGVDRFDYFFGKLG